MEKFIFTFGVGQLYEGFYQPIHAKDFTTARKKMIEVYGTKWSMQYTEKEWKEFENEAWYRIEHPLKAIYCEEDKI